MPDHIHPFIFNSASEMTEFAVKCAPCIVAGQLVFLNGNLGSGKTTLAKGLLAGWGFTGRVTSPTFTLLESYELGLFSVHHFDLYRMESSDELDMIGARELFNPASICLIEWPDRAAGYLPLPDVAFNIEHCTQGRRITIDGKAKVPLKECIELPEYD